MEWFAVGVVLFIAWLVLMIVVTVLAVKKGRSGFGWFCFAFFTSPVLAGIVLLAVGNGKRFVQA